MRRKSCAIAVASAFAAISLVGASYASAATQIGSSCVGNRAEPGVESLVELTNSGSYSVAQAGVITKWGVSVVSYPGGISEKLKVFHPAGAANSFTTVGESAIEPIVGGANSFETRIPVQVGDRIGVYGSTEGAIYCEEASASIIGGQTGDFPVGSPATFLEYAEGQVAVSATIEPDADGDGYGDETQDKCPQSATTQAPCPTVVLNASASAKGNFATVVVTSSVQAAVTVAGNVKLGKGKTAKLSGGTQIVAPGALAKFTVPFTGKLKSALKKLSRKQSLKLKLTASAPNVVGAATVSKATVKLKGQAKAKRNKRS